MVFDRVAADSGSPYCIVVGHSAVFAGDLPDLHGELGQVAQDDPVAFNSALQFGLLFAERFQKKRDPGLPVQSIGSYCALRLAQGQIVTSLVRFDHAFQRAVRHRTVAGLQKQQCS